VLAFEPDRYNLAALRHNVARATNVTVIPKALADRPGTVSFYETRGTIGSSIVARNNARRREVETTSVDVELAGRTFAALLVKLNIEGAELLALEGMHETLARGSGGVAILVEINPPLLAAAGSSGDAVVEWLTAERFTVERVDLPTQEPRPLERPLAKGHLLARRPHADDVVPHLEHGIRRELDDERT
jgi:FkbM family methyltransferase